jgi:hypothetical protein
MSFSLLSLLLFSLALLCVNGHMSIYIPSMWGSEPGNPNANWAVQPLQDYNFVDWWMHGTKSINDPPPANAITQLPAGGFYDFEITGNKRYTSMGDGLWVKPGSTNRSVPDPWTNDMGGYGSSNIHAPTHASVGGCAIGIAYKSNIGDVQPSDFVIISVVHDCIARQLQTFDIPPLPACPNGKCICSWFWIHNSVGGTDQMYMTPFQCNIQNPTTYTIGTPSAPVRCDNQPACYLYPNWGSRVSTCAKVLNPMYWANNQGNNMLNPTNSQCAPVYNDSYGFPDGAQNQIFTNRPAQPSNSLGDTLFSTSFISSSSVLISPAFRTTLVVQSDGNVVLKDYPNGTTRWSTNTAGKGTGPHRLTIQSDGNLVLYDSTNTPQWSSGTAGKGVGPYRLKLRDNKTLVVVDSNSTPLWKATTN